MNCPRCSQEIDVHPSGPCLDAWVAEAVMGWTDIEDKGIVNYDGGVHVITGRIRPDLPSHAIDEYSTTGDGMLEVMERMCTLGRGIVFGIDGLSCSVELTHHKELGVSDEAPTAPLAVCRAAIKAVGDKHD